MPEPSEPTRALPAGLALTLAALGLYRFAYHSTYLGEDAFALATFSDGRHYELAARDILAHAPLGSEAFYLQGLYSYFMAGALLIYDAMASVLLLQLTLAALALWAFHRLASRTFGRIPGALSSIVLLAAPAVAFYENKFLSAELGIIANIVALVAFGAHVRRPSPTRAGLLGASSALTVLARPNLLLAVPFTAWALWRVARSTDARRKHLLGFAAGLVLALAPMAARNAVVTGSPSIMPSHGGGTSYFIGNNARANGVWNTAGGFVSADLQSERSELAARLDIDDDVAAPAEIGSVLYERAFRWGRENPGAFLALQAKKVWLTSGNTELAQDYDWLGEQEIIPWAHRLPAPFGVLFALGILGFARLRRADAARWSPWLWVLGGQFAATFAANVIFFTSAQHRMPLAVPLAFLAGPGLMALWGRRVAGAQQFGRATGGELLVAAILLGQSFVPRARRSEPSAVHYHNLSVVQSEMGLRAAALESITRAVQRRPDHAGMRLEHARLLWQERRLDEADQALDALARLPAANREIEDQSRGVRRAIAEARANDAMDEAWAGKAGGR